MVLNAKLFRQLSNYTLISRLRVALSGNLIPQSQQAYVRYIACQYTGLESVHGRSLLFQPHRQYCAKHDRNLTPTQIKALIQAKSIFLLDVREPHELVEEGKINGSLNISDYDTVGKVIEALSMEDDDFKATYGVEKPKKDHANVVFYCKGGVRSDHAMKAALSLGFNGARHLIGGMDEWKNSSK